jgi:DNA sulfur modification protein DndC
MLKKVLEAQVAVQRMGPPEVKDLELLPLDELEAIRKIWLEEKHEAEDTVPTIYANVIKQPFPGKSRAHHPIMNNDVLNKLKTHCEQHGDNDGLLYQQVRAVMSVANKHRNQLRRAKLNDELNDVLDKGAFDSLFEAKKFALERERHRLQIKLSNDETLIAEEKEKIHQDISVITASIKEDGYSSLLIDTVEMP